ncbi:MAG: acyl-CoA dehydrogenase family protein [Steroidobacteraceae bacterium]|nr:acyl-CoA dehydrogenase family protein [Steroidobacteraceae bacterium]MDW8260122.1 acyl-CoA dehydrogenase family protein [Gammaproteobacteria bacterium]
MSTASVEETLEPNLQALLAGLDRLGSVVREHARTSDETADLARPVIDALVSLGIFRVFVPRRYGGLETELPSALELFEAAAHLDGSVGWAAMIGAGGGLFAAFLEPDTAQEIFGAPNAVIAGSGAADGRAERVPGGYRVTGRWRYASGASYATTFTANCLVTEGGSVIHDATGAPLIRAIAFDRAEVSVFANWDTVGMRGTGSVDFAVAGVFVPERRTFSVFTDSPRVPGPLYRIPFTVLTELPITAVALGIARRALDEFAALAQTKPLFGSTATLASDPVVQGSYARSHARWASVRAALFASAARLWERVLSGADVDTTLRAETTAGCVHAVLELRAAVDELASHAGMTAIAHGGDLGRAQRDLQTLAAHFAVAPRQLVPAGAELLGQHTARHSGCGNK